jgi:hypothetical protein
MLMPLRPLLPAKMPALRVPLPGLRVPLPGLRVPLPGLRALLLATLTTIAACSGSTLRDPDGDGVSNKAQMFSRLGPTGDKLDPAIGDVEDWRYFIAQTSGKLELRLTHGRFGAVSTLAGTVTIYNPDGTTAAIGPIESGSEKTTRIAFPVRAEGTYVVQIKAASGKGEYVVELGAVADPCDACSDRQNCVEGRCVDKPCGGACAADETCDARNRCVRESTSKCAGVRCGRGEVCQASNGKCVVPAAAAPKCGASQVLKDGECVEKVKDIECTVVDVRESGGGSTLTLSAGDRQGVTKGMSGSVKGVKGATFTIVEVYPSRAKAVTKVPPASFSGNLTAAIKR